MLFKKKSCFFNFLLWNDPPFLGKLCNFFVLAQHWCKFLVSEKLKLKVTSMLNQQKDHRKVYFFSINSLFLKFCASAKSILFCVKFVFFCFFSKHQCKEPLKILQNTFFFVKNHVFFYILLEGDPPFFGEFFLWSRHWCNFFLSKRR